jgi:bifunctional non-homologous end joining protein LigD
MKVTITHPDKLLFPKIKKKEFVAYYQRVASRMLPLIKDRPISMKRYPQGVHKPGFFQKNLPTHPKWIKTVTVKCKSGDSIQMLVCNTPAALLWLANQNCITPHIALSRYDKPNLPDRLIFDLDPPSKGSFHLVVVGALALKQLLEKKLGLKTFINTTGSKGLHLVVPIKREYDFATVRKFARTAASYLVKQAPKKFTIEVRKAKRRGRLYIDVARNGLGQTVAAPYAVRAAKQASIALPISWKALPHIKSDSFTIKSRLPQNPWGSLERSRRSLAQAIKRMKKLCP